MSSRTFRKGWPMLVAAVGAALVGLVSGGGRAGAATDCWYGAITLSSPPLLSAPDPAHVGDTITSSGGGWATCGGEAINGFNKEWLRDGTVISGPDWVDGWPGSFTYTVQAADVGHELRSAVSPCDDDFGCYTPPAQSSNAVVPVSTPPPPPPPANDPIVAQGYVTDLKGLDVSGAIVELYLNLDTNGTQSSPLDVTTTDESGHYVLRAPYEGAVADVGDANDGWVNFDVLGTSGDVPYNNVAARRWDGGEGRWLTPEEDSAGDGPDYPVLPEDIDLEAYPGASIANGDWPNVSGPCRYPYGESTQLVSEEARPTVIGELHVARDATGRFYYGRTRRADSHISIAVSSGGWHLGSFRHVAASEGSGVSIANPSPDWAKQIVTYMQYGLLVHTRWALDSRGQPVPCGSSRTIEPLEWSGAGITPGADESKWLHKCRTWPYIQWSLPFGPTAQWDRTSYKLRTWEAAATVDLGSGGVTLKAWSGASQRVRYHYAFGTAYQEHWLCGSDGPMYRSTRIFAGG
jgi:hypothetical protein